MQKIKSKHWATVLEYAESIRDGKKIKIGWLCSQQKPLSENAKQYAALLAQEINARENG